MTQSTLDDYQDSGCIDYTDPDDLREAYWGQGMQLSDIVERSEAGGLSTVKYHMNKHGIERRSQSEINRQRHAGTYMNPDGYVEWVSVNDDGQDRLPVHRLIAVAEWGVEAVKDKHVHHKNEIPWDNRPDNLELMDPTDHHSHHSTGESHSQAKLSADDVREIDSELKNGERAKRDIAEEYGVSPAMIRAIETGRNWTHITGR